jgi:hypothetical protein
VVALIESLRGGFQRSASRRARTTVRAAYLDVDHGSLKSRDTTHSDHHGREFLLERLVSAVRDDFTRLTIDKPAKRVPA